MTDLAKLKELAEEALSRGDRTCLAVPAVVLGLLEELHYANGVADLAMKHRDIAEASNAALREALTKIESLDDKPARNAITTVVKASDIARAALGAE